MEKKLVILYETLLRKAKVYQMFRFHQTFKDIVKIKREISRLEKTVKLRNEAMIKRANWAKQKITIMNELNQRSNERVEKKIDKLQKSINYLSKQLKPII